MKRKQKSISVGSVIIVLLIISIVSGLIGKLFSKEGKNTTIISTEKLINYTSENLYSLMAANGLGDVNDNGIIDKSDAKLVIQYIEKIETLDSEQQERADVDKNGKIELSDVILILDYSIQNNEIRPNGLGDINQDGFISKVDVDLILQHCAEKITLNSEQQVKADVNRDEVIDLDDASTVFRYIKDIPLEANGLGDVDNDGSISQADVELILKHVAETITLDSDQQVRADANHNESIGSDDAALVLKHMVKDIPIEVHGLGDVNDDGTINQTDVDLIFQHCAETITLDSEQQARADVNSDGIADTDDTVLILKYIEVNMQMEANGLGDVNDDGFINQADVELILKHCAEIITLDSEQQERADVNSDRIVNTDDAVLISEFINKSKQIMEHGLGDVNDDGIINKDDAILVYEKELTAEQEKRSDVNSDGNVDIDDVLAILEYVLITNNIVIEPDGNTTWSKTQVVTFLTDKEGYYTIQTPDGDGERVYFKKGDRIEISDCTGQCTIKIEWDDGSYYQTKPYYLDNSVTKVTEGIEVTVVSENNTEKLQQQQANNGTKYFSGSYKSITSATINIKRGFDEESGMEDSGFTEYQIQKQLDNNELTTISSGTISDSENGKSCIINEFGNYIITVKTYDNLENEKEESYLLVLNKIEEESSSYTIEYYYQQDDGTYSDPETQQSRTGKVGSIASVIDTDKNPKQVEGKKYVFDEENANNKLTGTITEDGKLTLKLYFKQQYTVTYKPGTQGTFSEQKIENLDYNEKTPTFQGEKTGNSGYLFVKWNPEISERVTQSIDYVAQWEKNTTTDPGETETPGETENPGETETPGETENPGETETPGETENPGGTNTTNNGEYSDSIGKDTQKNMIQENLSTTASSSLPKTGSNVIILVVLISSVLLVTITYLRYKKYKDI